MVPGFLHRCLGSKEPAPQAPTASTIPTGLPIPRPIFPKVSTRTEDKDVKTLGESLSLAPLDKQNLLILHLERLPSFALTPTPLIAVVFTITLWDQKRSQFFIFWKPNILLPSLFHNETGANCTCFRNQDGIIQYTAYSRYCCKEAAQVLRILVRQLVHTPTNIIILTILTMLFKGRRHERGE